MTTTVESLESLREYINLRLSEEIEIIKEREADLVKEVTCLRKPSDTTKYTQFMFDFVMYAHNEYILHNRNNPKERKTIADLAIVINRKMGTDKSKTSLSQIWNGHLPRATLATGDAYFSYGKITKDERFNKPPVS